MTQTNLRILLAATMSQTVILTMTLITANFALSSTGFAYTASPTPKRQQTRIAYRADLDRVASENNVPCKVSLDCEALPVGSKSCGGPTEYFLMTKATRMKAQAAISDLTKIIAEMDQEANSESGTMGTCEVVEKPELACKAGVCAAAPKTR